MADITEQQEVAQQISDAISRPVGFGDDVDEVTGGKGVRKLILEEAGELVRRNIPKRLWGKLQLSYAFRSRNLLFFWSHIQDELLEELEELEQEELARELLNVGDKEKEPQVELPSVPSTLLPTGPGTQTSCIVSGTREGGRVTGRYEVCVVCSRGAGQSYCCSGARWLHKSTWLTGNGDRISVWGLFSELCMPWFRTVFVGNKRHLFLRCP